MRVSECVGSVSLLTGNTDRLVVVLRLNLSLLVGTRERVLVRNDAVLLGGRELHGAAIENRHAAKST